MVFPFLFLFFYSFKRCVLCMWSWVICLYSLENCFSNPLPSFELIFLLLSYDNSLYIWILDSSEIHH